MNQTVTIKLVVKYDQAVLLYKQTATQLSLPGGLLPAGVSPQEFINSFLAKVGEFELVNARPLTVVSRLLPDDNTQNIVIVFDVNISTSGKQIESRLSGGYEWQKLYNLQPENLDEVTREVLQVPAPFTHAQQPTSTATNDVVDTTKTYHEVIIHTDGGSRGNPGPSAAGFVVLTPDGTIIDKGGAYLGITTNNQAEYQAVNLGLEKARQLGARLVNFRLDSLLVVNQMLGLYQIKNRDLWPIYSKIKELMKEFDNVTFQHVKREFNSEADALVNKTLDEHQGGS
jgi:ribonuclease HI